eukprot:TRINITY_DN4249_c0_g2_i1.p1 TRINITY_DN4249_c0_g2~~TRINITY_DN4249_c0_g2_i1.p1  ORF type:complete len:708 (+),score=192.20 TRINITY_DN4249_c0_g2_i1:129-2252(+)
MEMPYPNKMRDDWDLEQATRQGKLTGVCDWSSGIIMKAQRSDSCQSTLVPEMAETAEDLSSAKSITVRSLDEILGNVNSRSLNELLGNGSGRCFEEVVVVDEGAAAASSVQKLTDLEKALLDEVHSQRNLLRRSLEDSFDLMERRVKLLGQQQHKAKEPCHINLFGRHEPAEGELPPLPDCDGHRRDISTNELATLRTNSGKEATASITVSDLGAMRGSLYGDPEMLKNSTGPDDGCSSAVEDDSEQGRLGGEDTAGLGMHRVQSNKRIGVAVSEESRHWTKFAEKMKKKGGLGGGPQGVLCNAYARLRFFTEHKYFELVFAVLILLNTAVMGVEVQYKSLDLCYNIGFYKCERPARELWPQAELAFYVLDLTFGVLFTAEIGLKMISQHIWYFASAWSYIDVGSMVAWYLVLVSDTNMAFDPLLIRLARVIRLLRFLRLVKAVAMFEVLQLLIGSLRASGFILFWSAILLVLIMACAALVAHNIMLLYINNPDLPMEIREETYMVFGSFTRAFVTIYNMTFSLDTPAPSLCYELNEFFVIPLLLYQGLVSFAVIKVIEAVFLNETIKLAASNDDLMIMEKNRWETLHEQKVKALFEEADETGDGFVDYTEFMMIMNEEKVISWLDAIEVEVEDPKLVWDLLCSFSGIHGGHSDKLNVHWFVKGIGRLKGSAKSLDVLKMLRELSYLKHQMEILEGSVRPALPPPPV